MTTTPPPEEENLIEPRREGRGGRRARARELPAGVNQKNNNRCPQSLLQVASPGPRSQKPRATETPCSKSNRTGHARTNGDVNRAL